MRRVGGLKVGVIGLGGGHHVARLRAGVGMSILDTSCLVSCAIRLCQWHPVDRLFSLYVLQRITSAREGLASKMPV